MQSQFGKLLAKDYRISVALVDVPRGSYIKPMLAANYPGWTGNCFIQPKLDGMRSLTNVDGLWSRTNKQIVAAPHIADELKEFFAAFPEVILDGELYNHDRHDDFNGLMSICRKTKLNEDDLALSKEVIQYHIYDCFMLYDKETPFRDRLSFINAISELHDYPSIRFVPTTICKSDADVSNEHIRFVSLGYEGSIIRLDRPYEQKRSATLLKNKNWITEEFEVLAVEEGQGNWSGCAKTVRCKTKSPDAKEETFGAGITGSKEFCQTLLKDFDASKYESVTIRHFGMTPDGSYRFPTTRCFNERNSLEKRPPIDSESTEEEL
jgi:DNA ligase-1